MINPIAWFRQRQRATILGSGFTDTVSGKRVWYWADLETGRVWMASGRYSLFSVPKDDSPEDVIQRLKGVQAWQAEEGCDEADSAIIFYNWRDN